MHGMENLKIVLTSRYRYWLLVYVMTILDEQTARTTITTLLSAIRETITLKKYKNVKKYFV